MMSRKRPILTLTTDFGNRDQYVSAMKGVILSICEDVRLIDVSHDIPPQDIMAGAWVIKNSAFLYPPGTVHLVVVDPGVGTKRNPVLVRIKDQLFVGPDNGLFSLVADQEKYEARILSNKKYWNGGIQSATFHGRDVFAPIAAHLCNGTEPEAFGDPLKELVTYHWALPIVDEEGIQGWVVHIDHYGNLITNITRELFNEVNGTGRVKIFAGNTIIQDISETFASVPEGESTAVFGSSGMLEIIINKGSAESMLGIEKGAAVSVMFQK